MDNRKLTIEDTNHMGWEEFGGILNNLVIQLREYQLEHNIEFDIIAPILRSGAIPATVIANKLNIIRFLPVQINHMQEEGEGTAIKQILSIPDILIPTPNNPNILICETNTGSGKSAETAINLIKDKYPNSTTYYATVAKVFGGPDHFENTQEYFWGIQTNESLKANKEEEEELSLRPGITIFPWETANQELVEINKG